MTLVLLDVKPFKYSLKAMILLKNNLLSRFITALVFTLGVIIACANQHAFAASEDKPSMQYYDTHALGVVAQDFIQAQAQIDDTQQLSVSAVPLDSRIPTRQCAQPLQTSTNKAPPFNRQVTVELKCQSPQKWNQYVHVRVEKLSPVIVASEHIARGQIISKSDLTTEMRPEHFVRARYVEDPALVVGSRSKRTIRSGLPISLNQLCMVCKGDYVNIMASYNGLQIKTTGEALEDGSKGEHIRVRNKKSGRLISAKVEAVETVSVNI